MWGKMRDELDCDEPFPSLADLTTLADGGGLQGGHDVLRWMEQRSDWMG